MRKIDGGACAAEAADATGTALGAGKVSSVDPAGAIAAGETAAAARLDALKTLGRSVLTLIPEDLLAGLRGTRTVKTPLSVPESLPDPAFGFDDFPEWLEGDDPAAERSDWLLDDAEPPVPVSACATPAPIASAAPTPRLNAPTPSQAYG